MNPVFALESKKSSIYQGRREVFSVITYFEKKLKNFARLRRSSTRQVKFAFFLDHAVNLYMFCAHFKLLAPQANFLD